jgi:hypothetical protein
LGTPAILLPPSALESRQPRHDAGVLRRLVPLLAAALASAGESLVIEAPGASTKLGEGGVVTIAGQGFVARRGDMLLTGEALRWDQRGDSLWASGEIVYVMPTVRLHAARIGLRPEARTGDAWEVEAWIEKGKVRLHVRAERVELRPDRLTFHGVETDFGHGGTLSMRCPTLHIHLREEQRMDKGADQIDRYIEGIEAISPVVRAAGVPVLWFPYLYRDYILDYPWSTVEAGHTARLGYYLRYRVGSNLPEMAGWHTRLEARADRHTRAGNGFGLAAYWKSRSYGRGGASVYRLYRERVADPADQSQQGGERDVNQWDAEHYVSGQGWAAAGRYTVLPDADPSKTLPDGRSPDERFRADFAQQDLEEKPFARQGVSGAWVQPWISFTTDAEQRANQDLDETERLFGAEASIPRLNLAGPLAVQAKARAERLRQDVRDTETSRLAWDGGLAAVQWIGGFAIDADAGLRGVAWSDGRLAGTDIEGTRGTTLPYADGGLRVRLQTGDPQGTRAVLSPRLGLSWLGSDYGEGNPGYDFGDSVDTPEVDRRYVVTGIDGELVYGVSRFSADLQARWGLRQDDREAVEVDGTEHTSSSALADLTFKARGSPHPGVDVVADGTWDARLGRWTGFDVRGRWRLAESVETLYNGAYVPPSATSGESWLHRAGGSLYLSRYRIDTWGEIRPGGAGTPGGRGLDLWHVGFVRRMVDGVASLSYENAVQPDQDNVDHRVAFGFVVGGDDLDGRDAARRAFGF